jgi:hypothetical protein
LNAQPQLHCSTSTTTMFQARISRRNNHIVDMRNASRSCKSQQPPKATLPSFNTNTTENGTGNTGALPSGFSSRIPTTLQQVFLSSNRGNNVDKPPPMKVANRMFRTFWSKAFSSNSTGNTKKSNTEQTNVSELKTDVTTSVIPTISLEGMEDVTPQTYLDTVLTQRGYPITHYKTLNTAYYNKPTPLQQASYSRHIIDLIKSHNVNKFQQIMMCGISSNPCNAFGESSLHMVCRRGDATLLKILLSDTVNAELHVADDYGRTPLHDACWASEMAVDVINLILQENSVENIHMFYMEDARGSLPLSYVHKSQYQQWIQYIESVKDTYWPVLPSGSNTMANLLVRQPPHTRPICDPANALSIELATMVVNGRLEPHEATVIKQQGPMSEEEIDATDNETIDDDSDIDDDDDDDDFDSSDEDEDDSEVDDVEMIQEMSAILYKQ